MFRKKVCKKNYRLTSLEYSQCAYRVFKIEGQRTKQVLLTGLNWKIVSTTESRNLPRHDVGFWERDPHWTNAADCWSLVSDVSICRSPGKVTENYSCLYISLPIKNSLMPKVRIKKNISTWTLLRGDDIALQKIYSCKMLDKCQS